MSQKNFQVIRPVHVHLKTDKVDLKKRPPWKKIFLHIFSIHSSSRTEKRCQMLQTLFLLFQCSKNPQCVTLKLLKICSVHKQTLMSTIPRNCYPRSKAEFSILIHQIKLLITFFCDVSHTFVFRLHFDINSQYF